MSDLDIRDLLTELVDPLEPPDVAGGIWTRAQRRRRQVRTTIVVGVAASTLTVAAGVAYVVDQGDSARPTDHGPSPTSVSPPEPDGTIAGFPAWVAPTLVEEADAPRLASVLPPTIDLSEPNPSVREAPIDRALAAFGIVKTVGDTSRFDGIMLVTADGQLRHLDAANLVPIPNPSGDPFLPFDAGSLSPNGSKLAFRQPGRLAIYDLPTNEWTSYDIVSDLHPAAEPVWSPDGATIRVGLSMLDLATGQVGLIKAAQPSMPGADLDVESWQGAERIMGSEHARAAGYLDEDENLRGVDSHPPAIVVVGETRALLVIPDQQERWKYCCAAAGWLDDTTVAYESRFSATTPGGFSQTMRILGWDIETGRVGLVSTITGSADMTFFGSYADLAD